MDNKDTNVPITVKYRMRLCWLAQWPQVVSLSSAVSKCTRFVDWATLLTQCWVWTVCVLRDDKAYKSVTRHITGADVFSLFYERIQTIPQVTRYRSSPSIKESETKENVLWVNEVAWQIIILFFRRKHGYIDRLWRLAKLDGLPIFDAHGESRKFKAACNYNKWQSLTEIRDSLRVFSVYFAFCDWWC